MINNCNAESIYMNLSDLTSDDLISRGIGRVHRSPVHRREPSDTFRALSLRALERCSLSRRSPCRVRHADATIDMIDANDADGQLLMLHKQRQTEARRLASLIVSEFHTGVERRRSIREHDAGVVHYMNALRAMDIRCMMGVNPSTNTQGENAHVWFASHETFVDTTPAGATRLLDGFMDDEASEEMYRVIRHAHGIRYAVGCEDLCDDTRTVTSTTASPHLAGGTTEVVQGLGATERLRSAFGATAASLITEMFPNDDQCKLCMIMFDGNPISHEVEDFIYLSHVIAITTVGGTHAVVFASLDYWMAE